MQVRNLLIFFGVFFWAAAEFAAAEAKYGHRFRPRPAKQSTYAPAKPPTRYLRGVQVADSKMTPQLARWIWWVAHREVPMSPVDIQRYLADYPDPIRRWNIPLRTVQWWCKREEQPNGKRLRRKGGGRKPSIPTDAENRIADLIVKNAKIKRCVSNYSVRVQLGMAVGKSIASHGIARRFRKRHGFGHDIVILSDKCLH